MFCSNCGNKLAEDAKFCSVCGAKVENSNEQSFRTIADIKEPVYADTSADPVEETVKPRRDHMAFDWSNVVDEPHKKEIKEVKSPWDEDTGKIDEKELFAEMTPSTSKSRTMSFIDVLRAEKEEKEKAAAEKAIEYTEVLEIGPDLAAFDDAPSIHMPPLYEDVDEHVTTPFDRPDAEKHEPEYPEEPKFETPDVKEEVRAPSPAEPIEKPAEESKIELSRETIAQFDEFVKSFEKEAGILKEEPRFEEPRIEEPFGGLKAPDFDLPDFLKGGSEKQEKAVVPETPAPTVSESFEHEELFDEKEISFGEEVVEEPTFEVPVIDETAEEPIFEEPKYEDYSDTLDFLDDDVNVKMEDEYLDIDNGPVKTEKKVEEPVEEIVEEIGEEPIEEFAEEPLDEIIEEPVEEFAEEPLEEIVEESKEEIVEEPKPVDEKELFKEIEETSPKHTGMTIAEPADTESEIEALKQRLAELTGTPVEEPKPVAEEPAPLVEEPAPVAEQPKPVVEEPKAVAEEPAPVAEPAPAVPEVQAAAPVTQEIKAEEPKPVVEEPKPVVEEPAVAEEEPEQEPPVFTFEPVTDTDVSKLFEGLEPIENAGAGSDNAVEDIYLGGGASGSGTETEFGEIKIEIPTVIVKETPDAEEAKVAAPEPEVKEEPPVAQIKFEEPVPVVEPTPAVPQAQAAAPVTQEVKVEEPKPVVEPAPVVQEVQTAAPVVQEVQTAAPVVQEVKTEEPKPVVEERPVVQEVRAEETPKDPSDALPLEELEKELFGDVPAEEAEAEETKKIDKFYTLYKKNEEFQRLLDEEYDKLKNGGAVEEKKTDASTEPPAEQLKAYRPVEDETIYMPKDEVEKQLPKDVKAETKPASAGAFDVKNGAKAPVVIEGEDGASSFKRDGKPDKGLAKAEKAAMKAEKKAAKKAAKRAAKEAKADASYDEVNSGNGVLTVLAVIIAVILVILLAVILILQLAPDSTIADWINTQIANITSSIGALPNDDNYLL